MASKKSSSVESRTWSITGEEARRVVASLPPVPDPVINECLGQIYDLKNQCIIRVPSPFAANLAATAYKSDPNPNPKPGLWIPNSVAEVCEIFQIPKSKDNTPWSEHPYPRSAGSAHNLISRHSGHYSRAYLACAVHSGYPEQPLHPWAKCGHHATICDKQMAIVVDCHQEIKLYEPLGAMVCYYRDGTKNGAIRWTSIDHAFVTRPHTLTIKELNDETNEDLRSWAIDHYDPTSTEPGAGWRRYLLESQAKVLDTRHNDIENTEEALYATPLNHNVLLATCPTGRLVALSVPETVKTCEATQAWIHRGIPIMGRT